MSEIQNLHSGSGGLCDHFVQDHLQNVFHGVHPSANQRNYNHKVQDPGYGKKQSTQILKLPASVKIGVKPCIVMEKKCVINVFGQTVQMWAFNFVSVSTYQPELTVLPRSK